MRFLLCLFFFCRVMPAQIPFAVPLSARDWKSVGATNTNKLIWQPDYQGTSGGVAVDFVASETTNYFYFDSGRRTPVNLTGGTLTILFKLTGSFAVPAWTGDNNPPRVRPYIAAGSCAYCGTNSTGDKGRWWANSDDPLVISYVQMAPGTYSLTIPLAPNNWTNTWGQRGTGLDQIADFNATMAGARYIGVTFGGQNFFGHGVNGAGSIEILNYTVIP